MVWAVNVNLNHADFEPRGLPKTMLVRLHSKNPRAEQAFESKEYSWYLQWLSRKPLAYSIMKKPSGRQAELSHR